MGAVAIGVVGAFVAATSDAPIVPLLIALPLMVLASFLAGFQFNNRLRHLGKGSGGWFNRYHVLESEGASQ